MEELAGGFHPTLSKVLLSASGKDYAGSKIDSFMTRFFFTVIVVLSIAGFCHAQAGNGGCPKVVIVGPPGITNDGELVEFKLEADDAESLKQGTILWSVNDGEIEEGQGTRLIKVRAPRISGELEATVEFRNAATGCGVKTTEYTPVYMNGDYVTDIYGETSEKDEKARLDAFFAELSNHPTSYGFILFYLKPGDSVARAVRHSGMILRHAKFRRFDKPQLLIGITRSDHRQTMLFRLPKDAELPSCEICDLLHR